jgi:hypothetical protein
LTTALKQIYGNDIKIGKVLSDSNVKEDPDNKGQFTAFDAYAVIVQIGNITKRIAIELKKYDNYYSVEDMIKESEKDYTKFIKEELFKAGLEDIQKKINKIKSDRDIYTKKEYKELLNPLIKQKADIYSETVKPLSGNNNTKFSFRSKVGATMKYTKMPEYIGESNIHPYHTETSMKHIKSLHANKSKSKPKAKQQAHEYVAKDNDILFLVLTKGALLGASYKQYLSKFDNAKHMLDTAQFVPGAYLKPKKGAKRAEIDSYNINFHNMNIINTKNVKPIDDDTLKTMRETQRLSRLSDIKRIRESKNKKK